MEESDKINEEEIQSSSKVEEENSEKSNEDIQETKEIEEQKSKEDKEENTEMKKAEEKPNLEEKQDEKIGEHVKEENKPELVPENKQGKIRAMLSGKGKEASWKPFIFVMAISLVIAFAWNSLPVIKNSIHAVLDPSAGALLNWNLTLGMLVLILIISFFTNLAQKYCTDQDALRELRKEQKILQEKQKEFRDHPEKMMEIQKEVMPLTSKTMKLSMRAVMFTGVPFILFFRWFNDFFTALGDPKFFGFLSWFWFYLIFTMVFSSIFRKVLKVV